MAKWNMNPDLTIKFKILSLVRNVSCTQISTMEHLFQILITTKGFTWGWEKWIKGYGNAPWTKDEPKK